MRGAPTGLDRGLLAGLAVFRWVAWVWMAIVLLVTRDVLGRPVVATVLAGIALAVTAAATVLARVSPGALLGAPAVVVELATGAALLAADDFVYDGDHAQSLGSAWPIAGVMAAGVGGGPVAGAVAGAVLGLARVAGHADDPVVSLTSTGVLFALAGGAQGLAAVRLRRADREIADARARDEVARTLHDGVLQTLAIVQRRSTDADLARLAREQEHELREFLYGGPERRRRGGGDLGAALRGAAARFEARYGGRARVVVAEDLPEVADDVVDAVAGAVGEALTNAAKHGGADTVTVFAEPDEGGGVFCSVKDDGAGFDGLSTPEGVGIARSIRGRIEEVGGRVEIDGGTGRGTEVRLWAPARR